MIKSHQGHGSHRVGSQQGLASALVVGAVAYANAFSEARGLTPFYRLEGVTGTPGTEDFSIEKVTFQSLDADGYRMPTEAEWEYAARAGSTSPRYGPVDEIAWYGDLFGGTNPVCELRPNDWGLYDMLGNVYEWVWDCFGHYKSASLRDPLGAQTGQYRVSRGGGCYSDAKEARSAYRFISAPGFRDISLGFRLARSAR